jgi:hypothetical protein
MSSILPMIGNLRVRILSVEPVSIHGDLYFDALVAPADDQGQVIGDRGAKVRLPQHLCKQPPKPGDVVVMNFLMGQVNGIQPVIQPAP